MSRAERRRADRISGKGEKVYTLTQSQIDEMVIQRVTQEMPRVTEEALVTMIYNSIMVIEGHFGELMRKEGRVERYVKLLEGQLECFAERYVTTKDMRLYLMENYDLEVKIT